MTTSDNGIALIKSFEGFVGHLYNDVAGNCTIGYGHLVHLGPKDGRAIEAHFASGITEPAACDLLKGDVFNIAEKAINQGVKVPLTQNQYDALASFTYNVGAHAFLGSTLLRDLNAGRFGDADAQFARWNKAGGVEIPDLDRRRAQEAQLFVS